MARDATTRINLLSRGFRGSGTSVARRSVRAPPTYCCSVEHCFFLAPQSWQTLTYLAWEYRALITPSVLLTPRWLAVVWLWWDWSAITYKFLRALFWYHYLLPISDTVLVRDLWIPPGCAGSKVSCGHIFPTGFYVTRLFKLDDRAP